jgi:imidazolonepropionase-like amidohydrolase
LGWQSRVGRIATGLFADIIAVDYDPLADLTQMQHVTFVMCGGTIIRHDSSASAATSKSISPMAAVSSTTLP